MDCEAGHYGENCLTVAQGYDPYHDFDLLYWVDRMYHGAFASTQGILDFFYAVLMWIFSGAAGTINNGAQLFGVEYFRFMQVATGPEHIMQNEHLGHAPSVTVAAVWLMHAMEWCLVHGINVWH